MNNDELTKIRELENQYHTLFQHSSDAIVEVNQSGVITAVNAALSNLTGYSTQVLLTKKYHDLFINKERVTRAMEKTLKGETTNVEGELLLEKGDPCHVTMTLFPKILQEETVGTIILAKRKESTQDALTNLPNRRYIIEKVDFLLKQSERSGEQIALLFIDLDRFKLVNDTLGHFHGDQILIEMAKRLRRSLASEDLLARVGGDEFVVIVQNVRSKELIVQKAEQLLSNIREPLVIRGYEFVLTASIGITYALESGDRADKLMKYSDVAMYRAKSEGGDRYELYDHNMRVQFWKKFHVENDLRKAIENAEFSLYYQPQVDLESGQLCGEEVLIRWTHPEAGIVSPGKFISIAEETGLIVPIGKWILEQACKQKKEWIDKGYPTVPISINLSLRQFLQKDIVETIQSIIKSTDLPPHLLKIEVTETVTIDIHRSLDVLNRLRALGVNISLDDFGTGYSSLQYVSQLPISELKIDQSFVKGLGKGMNAENIVLMIVNLAHSLNVKVIAEGVEHDRELAFLKRIGCDRVQGFLYSEPLDAKNYEQFKKKFMS